MRRIILLILLLILSGCSEDNIKFKDYSLENIIQLLDNMEPQYYTKVYTPSSRGSIEIKNNRNEGVYVTYPFIILPGSTDVGGILLTPEIEIVNGLYPADSWLKKAYIAANSSYKIQYSYTMMGPPATDQAYIYTALLTEQEYENVISIIGKYINVPNDLYFLPHDVLRNLLAYIAPYIIKIEYEIVNYIGTP